HWMEGPRTVPLNLAVLASGRGSNLKAILEAIKNGSLDAKVSVVICNVPGAGAIDHATAYGVRVALIPNAGIRRQEHEAKMLEELKRHDVDFIVLAGFMRVLSPEFLRSFRAAEGYYRVINIHPSLLPAFPGTAGYEEAYNYGVAVSGITVHLVDEKVDHGPILAQETFPRFADDTLETFKTRGLAVEHALYPKVLQRIAKEGVQFIPRRLAEEERLETAREKVKP
ncbi:MAG TPA: phosphoribosylglycinamide formyltransferase, partial [Candidatus Obscuribacterales bacterium]